MSRQHDAPDRKPKVVKVGALPPGAVPIFDEHGVRRGHVSGSKATAATVSRFGVHDARLGKRNNAPAWIGTGESNSFNRHRAELKLQAQRTIAKGSVTKRPTKPALAVRPERGG
jgi:hypothetical protein